MCWDLLILIDVKNKSKLMDYIIHYAELPCDTDFPFRSKIQVLDYKYKFFKISFLPTWFQRDSNVYKNNPKIMKKIKKNLEDEMNIYSKLFFKYSGFLLSYVTEDTGDKKFCGCNTGFIDENEFFLIRYEVYEFFKDLLNLADEFLFIYLNLNYIDRIHFDLELRRFSGFKPTKFREKFSKKFFYQHEKKLIPNLLYKITN